MEAQEARDRGGGQGRLQEKKPKGRPNVWREMVFRYVQEHEGGSGGEGPSAALVLEALKQSRK